MTSSDGTLEAVLDPHQLRDAELALLGLWTAQAPLGRHLPAEQPSGSRGPAVGSVVTLLLPGAPGVGDSDPQAPAEVVLRDEEHTPIARLTVADADWEGEVWTLRGDLAPMRRRESGQHRDRALTRDSLGTGPRRVVIFGRPSVAADELPSVAPDTLIVVPDAGPGELPVGLLVGLAVDWATSVGVASENVVVAPLAWRDRATDLRIVSTLAQALGDPEPIVLWPHGGTLADDQWLSVRADLDACGSKGPGSPLEQVDAATAAALRQWRPARSRRGLVLMFSGLSGSGKSTVARDLQAWLAASSDRTVTMLDGDVVRRLLSSGLGFDRAGRVRNILRIGWVAAEIARHGGIAICAPIAPYESTRAEVRRMVQEVGDFVLVHVATPLAECELRDLKGLYAKARAGEIPEFTGISDPYEAPTSPELVVDTSTMSREEALATITDFLVAGGWVGGEQS